MSLPKNRPAFAAGFSLLEMLIVLTIMGLMLSLIGARSVTAIESTRFARTADAGIGSIKRIRVEALLYNLPLQIIGTPPSLDAKDILPHRHLRSLDLPNGWLVYGDPILISKTGICGGGQLTLQGPSNRQASYILTPPLCEANRVASP